VLSLALLALACAAEPAGPDASETSGSTTACFGCACSAELPCGEGLECTNEVCSLIEETDDDPSPPSACGWNPAESWYDCGFSGEDPSGEFSQACPEGLTADAPCPAALSFRGCCDAAGDVWYCQGGVVVTAGC
jgi:hypothetical protein